MGDPLHGGRLVLGWSQLHAAFGNAAVPYVQRLQSGEGSNGWGTVQGLMLIGLVSYLKLR